MKILDFAPPSVKQRLEALDRYHIMDTAEEPVFNHVARRASEICDTPMSAVTLLDDRRQWFKARVGFDERETPIADAFCARAIEHRDEVLVVPDARRDARFWGNRFVTGDFQLRSYAGAPLVTPEGIPIGTVCVFDRRPHQFSKAETEVLRGLARETIAMMETSRLRTALEAERAKVKRLQESELYFRHLTENSLDLITILEADGTIRFESRSIEQELGHPPTHYRGRNAFEFVHPEDYAGVMRAFQDALARRGNTPVIRFRFKHADGTYRILEGCGNNLLDDPAVHGIVFNSRDVTGTVRLQEEIERSRVEKEDTLARLTGGVAHDFNNMLTAVQGLAELTSHRVPAMSVEAGYLKEIQAATKRGASLTSQLLAFSRRVVLQPQTIELSEWLRAIAPRLRVAVSSNIELTVVCHSALRVRQDPAQFEQVLLQLAANAREAMPHGGHFSIEAFPTILGVNERPSDAREDHVNYVQLTITDHGTGMDEATLTRIFEPFFTTKTMGHHPGLGLSMCKGIIEQSGGHLTVHSRQGRGTVFHLFLPAADTAIEDEIIRPPAPVPQATPSVQTILFVDDEPMLREIGQMILRDAGYHVIVAEDGPTALARFSELGASRLDLLVTDVIMPGMTGVQLAEEIARQRPGTPALLCSGYTRDALAHSGGLPAGVAFLPKPYALSTLLEKVTDLLHTHAV